MKEQPTKENVWVVTVYANDIEPVVTVFANEADARRCYEKFRVPENVVSMMSGKKDTHACIDQCPVLDVFHPSFHAWD